jgi:mannobiose 2-epimerase
MISLKQYKTEVELELNSILAYWEKYAVDEVNGGFYGFINTQNEANSQAEKGLVLNARILWSFATAYNHSQKELYLQMAHRAFQYLTQHFIDPIYGGMYWSLNSEGQMLNPRKQVYGQAFAIYGLSEYYRATNHTQSLELAIDLFHLIEKYSFDPLNGGYLEALSRDWQALEDVRLSEKDANEKKTMNTHLHILEAYTNLYRVWKDEKLAQQITHLLDIYHRFIIHPKHWYQHLFMTEKWEVKSRSISFGHDIEAAWLLLEAAEVLDNKELIEKLKNTSLHLTKTASQGLDLDWSLNNELNLGNLHLDKNKHWWVQAEAMVGFMNAYQLTKDESFLQKSWQSWLFIKSKIIDYRNGEWIWGLNANYELLNDEKVSFWKCPYHNVRACIEISNRIDKILKKNN